MGKKRLCKCGRITGGEICDTCIESVPHLRTTTERGYGSDWQDLSRRVREEQAICEVCDARSIANPATEVHHIRRIGDAPLERMKRGNLLAVCRNCHGEVEGKGPAELRAYLEQIEREN